jgi:transcriptional regulator with XRE-family HTH domain
MPMITLAQYRLQKQAEWGREISIKEMAEATGVSRDTISRLLKGTPTRIDKNTIYALCKFFDVPCGPVPFIVYNPDEEERAG